MTLTTDPRGIVQGRVMVSATSTMKRGALIGRLASFIIRPEIGHATEVTVRIDSVDGLYPRGAIVDDGTFGAPFVGRIVRLDRTVMLVCDQCRYRSGHTSWCRQSR